MQPEGAKPGVTLAEGHDGILVVRGSENCRDWNGIHYKAGLSATNVGAQHLSFIEPGVPHEVFNVSSTEPVVAVVARF